MSVLLACGCLNLSLPAQGADSLDAVQTMAADLARLRSEKARLEADWRWQRDTLSASIEALKLRAAGLEQRQTLATAKASSGVQELADLSARTDDARTRLQAATERLRTICDELITLRPQLPPRLSRALDLPYQGLADPELAPGERMQHVATIWARCHQFNRSITAAEESLALDGAANPRVLDVIYWGLSHAYALDRGRNTAYIGAPGASGWSWREDASIATRVASLIAIHRDESDPEFITVPAQATDPFASNRP